MTTKATVSQFKIALGSTASPPVYTSREIEEVRDITGFGKSNALIDVTSFDSGNSKEYVGGLADGVELTVKCNLVPDTSPPGIQEQMINAVEARETRHFRITNTAPTPDKTWDFLAVCKDWKLSPSVTDANQIDFVLKITGAIVAS